MQNEKPYRKGVGILLFNLTGQVFVGERIDSPGAWQMPQGGVDEGESLELTFYREMTEEIGTDKATILHIMSRKLYYEFPPEIADKVCGGHYRGQEQTWIGARFNGNDDDIRLDAHLPQEFKQWQWVELDKVIDLIVPFKRDMYREIIEEFKQFTV